MLGTCAKPAWSGGADTADRVGPWPEIAFAHASVLVDEEGMSPFVADPTLVVFHNPGSLVRFRSLSEVGDRWEWLAVDPDLLAHLVPPRARGAPPFHCTHAPLDPRAYMLLQLVVRHAAAGRPQHAWIEESLTQVLAACVERGSGTRIPRLAGSSRRNWVNQAKALCAARLVPGLTVGEIAARLGLSRYHLSRLFRGETGYGLYAYLVEVRVRAALEQLADRTDDVLTIAFELGFSSHSHLTAAFGARFGVTPSQFRAAHRFVVSGLPASKRARGVPSADSASSAGRELR